MIGTISWCSHSLLFTGCYHYCSCMLCMFPALEYTLWRNKQVKGLKHILVDFACSTAIRQPYPGVHVQRDSSTQALHVQTDSCPRVACTHRQLNPGLLVHTDSSTQACTYAQTAVLRPACIFRQLYSGPVCAHWYPTTVLFRAVKFSQISAKR